MNLSSYKKEISYLLKNNNGRLIDIAYKANEIIMKSGDSAPILIRYFFEKDYAITSFNNTNEAKIIKDNEVEKYIDKYAVEIWSWIDSILKKRPSTTEFYRVLYEYLSENKRIHSEKTRAFFLLSVWINPQIPYVKPGKGIVLEKDDFVRIFEKISKYRTRAKSIIFSKYSSRTEEASVLLKLLDELSSQEEKSVLLASIIRNVEIRTEDRITTDDKIEVGNT